MVALKQFKTGLDDITKDLKQQKDAILFFSFDVVNSTLYKSINPLGWSKVLAAIFKYIRRHVSEEIRTAELWRTLGDELVFIARITARDEIYSYIDSIFKIVTNAVNEIKTTGLYTSIGGFTAGEIADIRMQDMISLKSAAWIAVVFRNQELGDVSEDDKIIENYCEERQISDRYRTIEFLGNDIDAGFRVAENSRERRLVISYELANLLSKRTEYAERLHIIALKKLKGIWRNRFYPVIWYHNPEYCNGKSLNDSFYYDEMSNDDLLFEYSKCHADSGKGTLNHTIYAEPVRTLKKIEQDLRLDEKTKEIEKTIHQTKDYEGST